MPLGAIRDTIVYNSSYTAPIFNNRKWFTSIVIRGAVEARFRLICPSGQREESRIFVFPYLRSFVLGTSMSPVFNLEGGFDLILISTTVLVHNSSTPPAKVFDNRADLTHPACGARVPLRPTGRRLFSFC